MSREQIEEMAKDIFESGVAIDGIDRAFAAVHGADMTDSHFMRIAQHLYNAGYRKQEWISVGDRLPDAELQKAKAIEPDVLFPCLVVREDNDVSYIDKAWYWGSKFTTQNCTDITDSVTHWMPLPEQPKMKGGAE